MRALLQCFSQFRESRMSAGKFTIVQCLSHMCRQFERGTAGQVRCCWRDAAATERQARTHAGSYASIHAGGHAKTHTHTHKRTKRKTGLSGHGLGNPATTKAISRKRCKMEGKLVLITYRKSYMSFRLVSKSVTLNDLERHMRLCVRW